MFSELEPDAHRRINLPLPLVALLTTGHLANRVASLISEFTILRVMEEVHGEIEVKSSASAHLEYRVVIQVTETLASTEEAVTPLLQRPDQIVASTVTSSPILTSLASPRASTSLPENSRPSVVGKPVSPEPTAAPPGAVGKPCHETTVCQSSPS